MFLALERIAAACAGILSCAGCADANRPVVETEADAGGEGPARDVGPGDGVLPVADRVTTDASGSDGTFDYQLADARVDADSAVDVGRDVREDANPRPGCQTGALSLLFEGESRGESPVEPVVLPTVTWVRVEAVCGVTNADQALVGGGDFAFALEYRDAGGSGAIAEVPLPGEFFGTPDDPATSSAYLMGYSIGGASVVLVARDLVQAARYEAVRLVVFEDLAEMP